MKIKNYLLYEGVGGEAPGKLEMDKISYEDALKFCHDRDFDVENEIPDFKKNFMLAKSIIEIGNTKRKDMPVIDTDDVKKFQKRLEDGTLDINKPLAKDPLTKKNPFPTGLSGLKAKKWLSLGLKDGSLKDDMISVSIEKVPLKKLKPIQKQVYFDKSMSATIENGVAGSINFVTTKSFFILSSNDFIIDGHHRMLSGLLINPSASIFGLKIDLPIKKLLPLATSYGDAIGNKRNL